MQKIVYYHIDEDAARNAWYMVHMGIYHSESTTQEYKASVNKAYEIAEETVARAPERADEAYGLADSYAKRLAEWYNNQSRVGCMCPSVLISGPANFPTRKKEKQNAAEEANWKRYEQIKDILRKIRNLGSEREIIKSSDTEATGKLYAKIELLENLHEAMKKANVYYRKHGTLDGCEVLGKEARDEVIKTMKSLPWIKVPYPPYALQDNLAKIKSAKCRLAELEATKASGTQNQEITVEGEIVQVIENAEAMRIQFIFPSKPSERVRDIMKQHTYRWSPKNGAWQRQLTPNAKRSARWVIEDLTK